MTIHLSNQRAKKRWIGLWAAVLTLMVFAATSALANHPTSSLLGSNFEIDDNANLAVDDEGNLDWASVNEDRRSDLPTGRNDDSYAGGSKENDPCPGTTTGSIPNNKSDLLHFGVYKEGGSPGFLHFFWTRVQEPSGTTLMDFELNQSSTDCGNGVNKVRTVDDLLIEYRITQGGANATILVRKWTGSSWGPAQDLTAVGAASGTINDTAISSGESDGLGALSARTFGEASLNLSHVFQPGKCTSFGSAFVKSRASDSFTSQLKDFIKPVDTTITNCGKVTIRKVTDPSTASATFGFTKSFTTDPATTVAFTLSGAEGDSVKTYTNVLFGNSYTVTEDLPTGGWDFDKIDCNVSGRPSVGVSPTIDGRTVTFSIDDEDDVLDCTYYNKARGSLKIAKVTDPATDTTTEFTFTGTVAGSLKNGEDKTESNLAPGSSYSVTETIPAGWELTSVSCDRGTQPTVNLTTGAATNITVLSGLTTTCTFTNRQQGAIKIVKVTDPSSDTSTEFTFTPTGFNGGTTFQLTGGSGTTSNRTFSNLVPGGTYSVAETVPAGWDLFSSECTSGTTSAITVAAGQTTTCTFTNRKRAQVNITKVDDANSEPTLANRLNGAVFTLHTDVDDAPGAPVATTIANPNSCTTAGTNLEAGKCSILNIVPGTYWLVETTTPTGYGTAAPQKVTLASGANTSVTFVDPRLHKVIVLVCHQGTNDLAVSDVTYGTSTKPSLSAMSVTPALTAEQQAALCSLGGASFDGLTHGNIDLKVNVGSGAH